MSQCFLLLRAFPPSSSRPGGRPVGGPGRDVGKSERSRIVAERRLKVFEEKAIAERNFFDPGVAFYFSDGAKTGSKIEPQKLRDLAAVRVEEDKVAILEGDSLHFRGGDGRRRL